MSTAGGIFTATIVLVGVVFGPALGTGFFRIISLFDPGQCVVDQFGHFLLGRPGRVEPNSGTVGCLCGEHRGKQWIILAVRFLFRYLF